MARMTCLASLVAVVAILAVATQLQAVGLLVNSASLMIHFNYVVAEDLFILGFNVSSFEGP